MSEIKVNIEALDQKITQLRNLQNSCDSASVNAVDLIGGGESIRVINEVDQEYAVMKRCFNTLLTNSIQFFENVKQTVSDTDMKMTYK